MHNAERDSEQRAHHDTEDQHTETQSGVGLHAAGEQLGAVLVHAANIRYVGATVFISDRAANDGLGAQPREQECQNSGDSNCHVLRASWCSGPSKTVFSLVVIPKR